MCKPWRRRFPWPIDQPPNAILSKREAGDDADCDREEGVQHQKRQLRSFAVDVVLDDHLHAEPHVVEPGDHEHQQDQRDERVGEGCARVRDSRRR